MQASYAVYLCTMRFQAWRNVASVPFVSRCISDKNFHDGIYSLDLGMIARNLQIDASDAILLATRFLSQHHSGIISKNVVLKDSVWIVTLSVGFTSSKMRQVHVDADSGKILGCS